MRPWPAILDALEAEGVDYIFGLPGSPELLYNDLADHPRITPILVRHETSAVFMAMAYARISGKVGVVHASPGPGMANLLPGLLEAMGACSPLVCVVSGAPRSHDGMGAFQETPSLELARHVSKWAVRLELAHRTSWTLERAFSLAVNGKPGPVYVEVPGDVAGVDAEIPSYRPPLRELRTAGSPAALERAAELLATSERPVIVAGGGVGLSGAESALVAFAEHLDAPVLTTPAGRGSIVEDHRLAFGLVGLYRTTSSARPFDEADTVILVGTRMEEFQSGQWQIFPRAARVIQVDIDAFEIGRNIQPDVAVVGDARLVLEQLTQLAAPLPARAARTAELVAFRDRFEAEVDAECRPQDGELKTKQVVHALGRVFEDGFVLVNENGGQDLWSYYCPYLKVTVERGCVAPAEQTCMGFGVAGAIGAKLAAPERHVVCVTGDGAFQMFMKEVPTAVQYAAPVLWIVLNNRGLGWTRFTQRATGGHYIASDFHAQPDMVAIARASGAHAEQISAPAEIDAALGRARGVLEAGVPAVLDCVIDTWDYPRGFIDYHRDVRGQVLPEEDAP